jgi:magnesium-protoporphyrin O-methyltransferase
MSGCCGPGGFEDPFSAGLSRYLTRRYRKRGLDRTATRIVGFLEAQGIEGASVLDIGGGIGEIQLELLRRGAARATNLGLVDSYENEAAALAADAGVTDRITRRHVDLATAPGEVEAHDIVVLHRVVCCYPDHQRLLGAAAEHARRVLVFSHPPRNPASRAVVGLENVAFRIRRTPFRTYAHDPDEMTAAAARGPLQVRYRHRGPVWQVVGLTTEAA